MTESSPAEPINDSSQAACSYAIERWGDEYFGINAAGHACVHPLGNGVEVDLAELAEQFERDGLPFPVLVRFGDILRQRVIKLGAAFDSARRQHAYSAPYTAVYPIKVNQERHVLREIVRTSPRRLGLESGSKAELLAVLGLARRGSTIIVNGYKDREYLSLALAGQIMGYRVYIVVEKPGELDMLMEEAERLAVIPRIGVRLKLTTKAAGKWEASGGEKSKFGLAPGELLSLVERLRAEDKLDWLRLLHVHLGSQVADIRDVQRCIREAARYYTEVRALGVPIDIVDVGGGLGVHYDGSNSASDFSMNYGIEQYAEVIVQALAEAAEEASEPQPEIISESGRAIAAHHAVLITSVIDAERKTQTEPRAPDENAPAALMNLWRLYEQAAQDNPHAIHAEAAGVVDELLSLFNHGLITLHERAHAESIWYALCQRLLPRLDVEETSDLGLIDILTERLADRLFINLSIFQSLPDIWGIDQLFPIMPLTRLHETPTRHATLHDLTCDSDGRIDRFVSESGSASTLAVHEPDGKPYRLGIFLIGAYQEIIGDMHNLFGDTHAVNVAVHGEGYRIRDTRDGDTTADMLRYVHIPPHALTRTWRRRLKTSGLDASRQTELMNLLRRSLKSYTYLDR